MKALRNIFVVLFALSLLSACSEKEAKDYAAGATVPTGLVTGDIDGNHGVIVYTKDNNVPNDGGAAIESKGICFSSTVTEPTLSLDPAIGTSSGTLITGTGVFADTLTNLTPNTTYYYRAYAMNAAGIAYGPVKTFKTINNVVIGTLTTQFFRTSWPVEVVIAPEIGYYVVWDMYEDGYDVQLTVNGTAVTVAPQPVITNLSGYGVASVTNNAGFPSTWIDKVITLKLTFSVSAGTFNPNPATEVITFQ